MSYLLTTAAGTRILCGGDFSLSADLKTWRELYRPQIAVLGVGGARVGPVTVTELPPSEAAIAATWLGVHTVIPLHCPPGDPAPPSSPPTSQATSSGSRSRPWSSARRGPRRPVQAHDRHDCRR